MHLLDYVLLVLAAAASLGFGAGGIMLTLSSPRYKAIRISFWFAALCFGSLGILWGSHSGSYPMVVRLLAAGSTAALAAISLTYMLSLISDQDSTQPVISLSPGGRYEMVWDPLRDPKFSGWKEGLSRDSGLTWFPSFMVKNTGPIAYDVTVRWKAEVSGVLEMIKSSARFSKYKIDVDEKNIVVHASPGGPITSWAYNLALPLEYKIPILTRESEVAVPFAIYPLMVFFLIEKMPAQVGERSEPFPLTLSVEWAHPSGGKQQNFRIKAFLINNNPGGVGAPEASGYYEFTIEKL